MTSTHKIRTRYAPSPTGIPHVGNVRSALFAWLFARHNGGTFILRIEDTDQNRYDARAEQAIIESLDWLGLDQDEGPEVGGDFGPYRQSERLELYGRAARRLIEQADAYYCYCSPERLDRVRKEKQARKEPPGYDNHCRDRQFGPEESFPLFEGASDKAVVRFKMPLEGATTGYDQIRGEVTWENRLIDDFVILKSDQFPTYHLASVVDDHAMEITHVLRADEWLPSLPRHWLLYEAMGYEKPVFAHLPLILGNDRSKLSKRHGAVSVFEYRDQGLLPEALANFLALLGWSLDDHSEKFTLQELVEGFTLERVSASPAVFDVDKLEWMNGVYIRALSEDEFVEKTVRFWEETGAEKRVLAEQLRPLVPLIQERTKRLEEVWPQVSFFVEDISYPAIRIWAGMGVKSAQKADAAGEEIGLPEDAPQVRGWLDSARVRLADMSTWQADSMESDLRALADKLDAKPRLIFGALRVATTGSTVSPPLFETMEALGQEESLRRIERAVSILS